MYRHSAQIDVARLSLPSQAPDDSSDSETEILAELDEKRRELDDEIARFKAQKDKEFHNFEKELRSKRKNPRGRSTDTQAAKAASITSAVSSLFAGKQARPNGISKGKKTTDSLVNPGSRPSALPSQPTVSLDKLTINGTTTPPALSTSPLSKTLSRSPSNPLNFSLTPPRKSFVKPPIKEKCEVDFTGIITPTYLPLLEARGSSLPPSRVASPQPTRSLTAPIVPSTSLPSALRTASGTIRKRKHVTFQLADSAIVEPSSSYEEIPSPEKQTSSEKIDAMMVEAAKNNTANTPTASLSPTNEITSPRANFRGGLSTAEDGGSGVGFFELDEELDDPDDKEIDYHEVCILLESTKTPKVLIRWQDLEDDVPKDSNDAEAEREPKPEQFRASSLPIDIVRPGSFRNSSTVP